MTNFTNYVTSNSANNISPEEAKKRALAGEQFLKQIKRGGAITGTKEENMANLSWYLNAQSQSKGREFHRGMYTVGFGDKEKNKKLFEYFKGKTFKVPTILRPIQLIGGVLFSIANALSLGVLGKAINKRSRTYSRESSHFKDKVKGGHYGLDITRHPLPGGRVTTVFGLMDDGRMYIKPETAGVDLVFKLGESAKHTLSFLHSRKGHADPSALGHRESAVDDAKLQELHIAMIQQAYSKLGVKDNNIKQAIKQAPLFSGRKKQLKKLKKLSRIKHTGSKFVLKKATIKQMKKFQVYCARDLNIDINQHKVNFNKRLSAIIKENDGAPQYGGEVAMRLDKAAPLKSLGSFNGTQGNTNDTLGTTTKSTTNPLDLKSKYSLQSNNDATQRNIQTVAYRNVIKELQAGFKTTDRTIPAGKVRRVVKNRSNTDNRLD